MISFGDPVRTRHGATGRYVGNGLVLYVSAQDNDLAVDDVDETKSPWSESPLPTSKECHLFRLGFFHGQIIGPEKAPTFPTNVRPSGLGWPS